MRSWKPFQLLFYYPATLRHGTKEGLLKASGHTDSGYTLYPPEAVDHAKRIRELQEQWL